MCTTMKTDMGMEFKNMSESTLTFLMYLQGFNKQ